MRYFIVCFGLLNVFALVACTRSYTPKPIGYNRLILPDTSYQSLPDTLPYQFDYSRHSRLLGDTSYVRDRFWIEIYYPDLKANVHITYKRLQNSQQLLKEFMDDSYRLTAKHQIKAYAIDETIVRTPSGKTAIINEIEGEVPSQFQFTMTDSTTHFLRGALYFNTRVQNDSLAPAIEYMKREIMRMVNTLQWNEGADE